MKSPREILLGRHRDVEPKLERMWASLAAACHRRALREGGADRAPLQVLWRELILPSRRIWAGLACTWVVIIVLNVVSYEPSPQLASQAKPPSHEEMRALIEQRQLLAQMIGPMPEPAVRRKSHSTEPRSERTEEISAA